VKAFRELDEFWQPCTGTFTPYYHIPYLLEFRHMDNIFECFDFPWIGHDHTITLLLSKEFASGASGSDFYAYAGMGADTSVGVHVGVSASVTDTAVSTGSTALSGLVPTRLIYRDLTLDPEAQRRYAELIASKKPIVQKYTDLEDAYLKRYLAGGGVASLTVTDIVGQNVIKPKRLLSCMVNVGTFTSAGKGIATFPAKYDRLNVNLNQKPFWMNTLQTDQELYSEFKRSCDCGSISERGDKVPWISYGDWRKFYHIYGVDLSSLKSSMNMNDTKFDVQISNAYVNSDSVNATSVNVDRFHFLEVERTCVIYPDAGNFKVTLMS
jgi:hypothetical protein